MKNIVTFCCKGITCFIDSTQIYLCFQIPFKICVKLQVVTHVTPKVTPVSLSLDFKINYLEIYKTKFFNTKLYRNRNILWQCLEFNFEKYVVTKCDIYALDCRRWFCEWPYNFLVGPGIQLRFFGLKSQFSERAFLLECLTRVVTMPPVKFLHSV